MAPRILAIDWSGASNEGSKLWLAEAAGGVLRQLRGGWRRDALADHLIAEAKTTPELIVGMDFAFSLPAWFLEARGLASGPELWELAASEGEDWLARCEPPFWGRPGRRRPDTGEPLRCTDRDVPSVAGIRPKSVFQIGGAGAVGTGSLRGMPVLKRLRDAGFAVWPFDAPRLPLVVEIYPRLLTGPVAKSDEAARRDCLMAWRSAIPDGLFEVAAGSEDAFDAAMSALVMDAAAAELESLPSRSSRQAQLEGEIWWPQTAGAVRQVQEGSEMERSDVGALLRAVHFAAAKHRDQRRKDADASPYINHPIAVADILANVGGITDLTTLLGAILHDTVEDTDTTPEELELEFGPEVRLVVAEMTDDKSLPKDERKRLQVEHAPFASSRAKAIKLGDKICNVVDITNCPPADWSSERRREYLAWSVAVVEGCRGTNAALERHFDEVIQQAREALNPGAESDRFAGAKARTMIRTRADGAIVNAIELTADDVARKRALCPACRNHVFQSWPAGWDAHAASSRCAGLRGKQPEERKKEFKQRFRSLFR